MHGFWERAWYRTLSVTVTAKDLQGDVRSIRDCPIATAFRRAVQRNWVRAGPLEVSIGAQTFPLPKSARHAQWALMGQEKVEPFTFTLRVPRLACGWRVWFRKQKEQIHHE